MDAVDLDIPEASIYLFDNFIDEDCFRALRDETKWSQRSMSIAGREVLQPRLTAWYGDDGAVYRYSGIKNAPLPWTPLLRRIRTAVEDALLVSFNSVLLNLYRSGQDSIGFHSDDEKELGNQPTIASLSFGASRSLTFKHKRKMYRDFQIPLHDRSMLLMMGDTQAHWQHGIKKCNDEGERINLTFRQII